MKRARGIAGLLLLAVACTDRMYEQERPDPARRPVEFAGVRLARAADTVARQAEEGEDAAPPPVTRELLYEGRAAYRTWCIPCHDAAGTGGGIVVQRGFTRPPSLHAQAQRDASDLDVYRAIRDGKGRMAGFADAMAPRETWAIVGYVRALQTSQRVPADELPPRWRQRLREPEGAGAK